MSEKKEVRRFSENQKVLRWCIESFIKLYYQTISIKELPNDAVEQIIPSIIDELFNVKSKLIYNRAKRKYETEYESIDGTGPSRHRFVVSNTSILLFRSLMGRLVNEVKNKHYDHLIMVGDYKEIEIRTELKARSQLNETDPSNVNDYPPQRNVIRDGIHLKDKVILDAIRNDKRKYKIEDDDFTVYVMRKRRLRMRYSSEFGELLLDSPLNSVMRVMLVSDVFRIISLQGLLRYVLVYLHVEFGDLKSLNICKYDDCKKIYLVKKKDYHEFCCSKCRKNYFDSDKRVKCRNSQNAWIRNKLEQRSIQLLSLQKDHCHGCNEAPQRGGTCIKLIERFDGKIEDFSILKKRKKSLNRVNKLNY